jgi:tetratricopeptide (TPR) repeat protein
MGLRDRYGRWARQQHDRLTEARGPGWQREHAERILERHRHLYGENAFTVINGKYWLAERLRKEDRDEEALDLLEQVLVQRADRYGPDHPKTREVRFSLAKVLMRLGRHREARDVLDLQLESHLRDPDGENKGETLGCRLWLASQLIELGDNPAAQEQLEAILRGVDVRGEWWMSGAEEQTKAFLRFVSSD